MTEKLDLNLEKINEYKDELLHYDGYIPSIIRWTIGTGYLENVLKTDKREEVIERMEEARTYTHEDFKRELLEWCKENLEYSDILSP